MFRPGSTIPDVTVPSYYILPSYNEKYEELDHMYYNLGYSQSVACQDTTDTTCTDILSSVSYQYSTGNPTESPTISGRP